MQPTDRDLAITADDVRALLAYEPETGIFRWRVWRPNGVKVGDIAGSLQKSTGYWVIKFRGRQIHASRLAWLVMTGQWPSDRVDHEDLDKLNNRWSNLRPATMAQNAANRRAHRNNGSGLKGVHLKSGTRRTNPWRAHIRVDGVLRHLGCFPTPEEAHAAYARAAEEAFGQFARSV